jgi:hypothetical protein
MSFRSISSRIKNVGKWFNNTSYKDIKLVYKVVDLDKYISNTKTDARNRILEREYSVDKAKLAIQIYDRRDRAITVNQIRDIFDKLGFNVDATLGELFNADVMLVYNIGGYVVPFYKLIIKIVSKIFPKLEQTLISKMSPGLKRLHCRLYNEDDGSWYFLAHVDNANWLNILNPIELIKSHLVKGTGNYNEGMDLMIKTFEKFVPRFNKRQNFFVDIGEMYKKEKRS